MKYFSLLRKSHLNRKESGQIIALFMVLFVLLAAAVVGSVDYGTYVHSRQRLEVAVDAAALAGTMELPTDGLEAVSMAESFLTQNDADVNLADVTVQFWCLVGDRDNDGSPDEKDVPKVCSPGDSASWTCGDDLCISPCELTGTNMCNTMGVTASKDVELAFTRLMGLPPVQITASRTGACKGLCGKEPPGPMDVIIILDRSGSMSGQDIDDAQAGAKAVLEVFDPELHYVGLAVLGASQTANHCVVNNAE